MEKALGKTVYGKTVYGRVKKFDNRPVSFVEEEHRGSSFYLEEFEKSLVMTKNMLSSLHKRVLEEVGEDEASIFEVHLMMLDDEGFINDIKENINNGNSAVASVNMSKDKYSNLFKEMDDEYMQARAIDIEDIGNRIIRNLLGKKELNFTSNEPFVLFAYDLYPSETISIDKDKLLGIITVKGSVNSHTAILARAMGIPALVSTDIEFDKVLDNETCIIDGKQGCAFFSPDTDILNDYLKIIESEKEKEDSLKAYINRETMTKEGKKIKLFANISSPDNIDFVLKNGAEGIGLFRSEFLYLGKESAPSEEEQFIAYKSVLLTMKDKPVIIRTLDIGADKQVSYLGLKEEENPALGLRGVRLCLFKTELFKEQLRALFRAGVYGNLKIMFPMITSEKEIEKINSVIDEVKASLDKDGIEYKVPALGIMIETPAAAVISDKLADKVDFFSIGTNDLTQYTLAMDRQADTLDSFFDSHHEAVLRLIELTAKNAHKAGIEVGICGELASDPDLTGFFIDIGIDELSMAAIKIPNLRKNICES